LESSSTGRITKSEVAKAIKDAAKESHVVLSTPEVTAAVESIFSQGDFNNSGSITRSQLREALSEDGSKVKALLEKQPVYQQVLKSLEGLSSAEILKEDVQEAIA